MWLSFESSFDNVSKKGVSIAREAGKTHVHTCCYFAPMPLLEGCGGFLRTYFVTEFVIYFV